MTVPLKEQWVFYHILCEYLNFKYYQKTWK